MSDDRAPITFYRDENRPVEVGTPVYDADGQVVAHVVRVADDGSITIRALKRQEVEGAPACRCTHRLARHDRNMACTEPDCDCSDYDVDGAS